MNVTILKNKNYYYYTCACVAGYMDAQCQTSNCTYSS